MGPVFSLAPRRTSRSASRPQPLFSCSPKTDSVRAKAGSGSDDAFGGQMCTLHQRIDRASSDYARTGVPCHEAIPVQRVHNRRERTPRIRCNASGVVLFLDTRIGCRGTAFRLAVQLLSTSEPFRDVDVDGYENLLSLASHPSDPRTNTAVLQPVRLPIVGRSAR